MYPQTPTPQRETPRAIWRKVYRGVRIVTQQEGDREWMDRVDGDRLDLGDPYQCILGQTYAESEENEYRDNHGWMHTGGYYYGVELLGLDADGEDYPGEAFGFVAWGDRIDQTRLEDMWRLALARLPR